MPDPVNEVPFERAVEILEVSPDHLEQLLETGVLRAYRRGDGVVFLRKDLANFITSSSAEKEAAFRRAAQPEPAAAQPEPAAAPPEPAAAPQDAAPQNVAPQNVAPQNIASQNIEEGMLFDQSQPSFPARPSPITGMGGGGQGPAQGPSPLAGMGTEPAAAPPATPPPQPPAPAPPPAPPPQPPAADEEEAKKLTAENESLKMRLKAAEEVLGDLQGRLESVSSLQSENVALKGQVQAFEASSIELEAKVAAYEEMDDLGDDRGWGRRDPEDELAKMKRETAELHGEVAGLKRRLEDADREAQRYRSRADDLELKLRTVTPGGDDSERVRDLEEELDSLTTERDMLAIEAEVAKELRGEIERASELEDKLKTQHEVIEAAQARLGQLEVERDEIEKKARELEGRLEAAESSEAKAGELAERARSLEDELQQTRQKAAQLEARSSALRAERDGLTEEIENRDEEMAKLRAETHKGKETVEELEKLKVEIDETRAGVEAAEVESGKLRADVSLKDQLLKQFKAEERSQGELETDNTRLREKVAEAEGRAKQAEARVAAIRAERDGLSAEIAKHEGAVSELRGQAERASGLLGENRALKGEIETARERAAEVESTVEMLRAEREKLDGQLGAATAHAEELERSLQSQERDLGSIREKVEAAPVDDRLRRELEALRGEISKQMEELSEVRAHGEAAASRRRSARAYDVAKRGGRRGVSSRRSAPAPAGGGKPERLGRFEIVKEISRSRSGTLYRSSLPPSNKPVDVLVLPPDLTRDRRFLDKFWREMRVVSELENENLLGVIDVGEADGVHYVAYEHVEGETLSAVLRREKELPADRALDIAIQVARGVWGATQNEIIHGDLKPENVLLGADGKVKVMGLGLAKGSEEDGSSLNERGRVEHYAAPEEILGAEKTVRGEVYAIGAILYRAVSGEAPLEGGSLGETRALVEAGELPQPQELPGVPERLRRTLFKALSEEPKDRYASPKTLLAAFERVKAEAASMVVSDGEEDDEGDEEKVEAKADEKTDDKTDDNADKKADEKRPEEEAGKEA